MHSNNLVHENNKLCLLSLLAWCHYNVKVEELEIFTPFF